MVDLRSIVDNLPDAIEAMFFLATSSSQEKQEVRDVHASFLGTFHLDDQQMPLLVVDLDAVSPFRVAQ